MEVRWTDSRPEPFIAFAVAGLILLVLACRVAHAVFRRGPADIAGFAMLPLMVILVILENVVSAIEASVSAGSVSRLRSAQFLLSGFYIPLHLLISFELSYTVHKRRSTKFFCCIEFNHGHRQKDRACGQAVRYGIWLVAFSLSIFSTLANAQYVLDPEELGEPQEAEARRFVHKGLEPSRFSELEQLGLDDFADVIPAALGVVFQLYIGYTLWRYGTRLSTDVSATWFNRWSWLTVAGLLLCAAWVFTPSGWAAPYLMNAAELLIGAALTYTSHLVDRNLDDLEKWDRAFRAVEDQHARRRASLSSLPMRFRNKHRRSSTVGTADSSNGNHHQQHQQHLQQQPRRSPVEDDNNSGSEANHSTAAGGGGGSDADESRPPARLSMVSRPNASQRTIDLPLDRRPSTANAPMVMIPATQSFAGRTLRRAGTHAAISPRARWADERYEPANGNSTQRSRNTARAPYGHQQPLRPVASMRIPR